MTIPRSVCDAYGVPVGDATLEVEHIPSNINQTFVLRARSLPQPLVLQRLHAVFGARVHVDIEAVTTHLAGKGADTPRLVPTRAGELWTTDAGASGEHVWRALTYVEGVTLHRTSDATTLESAAELLGKFQSDLNDLPHRFVHERPLHDTRRHLANLETAIGSTRGASDGESRELALEVARQAERVRLDFEGLPKRIIHGDPKLSNVLFWRHAPSQARCMIDLDTVGRGYLAYELGDALRSWCNPGGEDTMAPTLELRSFAAVMRGYARSCPREVTQPELLSAVDGFETVSVELASRFAADAINDSYFGWDTTRYASRREHNLVRARGQLALARVVHAQRAALVESAAGALDGALRG